MPRYMLEASYTAEGGRGLLAQGGSKRREAFGQAVKNVGGTVESFYYMFGKKDVLAIVELPDNATAAALSLALSTSGMVKPRIRVLLTVEELDKAAGIDVGYRAPSAT